MYSIVLYHIFIGTYKANPDFVSRSLWIPLHLGVPVFILISDYFHIKFSWSKFLKLVTVLFVYTIGIQVIGILLGGGKNYSLIFFISRSPYWFMTVYLMLLVLAPFINKVLESITIKEEMSLVIILAVISMYIGGFQNLEAYSTGKNVLNFIMIYAIGDVLHKNEEKLTKIPIWLLLLTFFMLNLLEVIVYDVVTSNQLKTAIWILSFPYNSPLLVTNAILLFVVLSRINVSSRWINWAAGSCLGIYMLHHHPVVNQQLSIWSDTIINNYNQEQTFLLFILLAFAIVVACVLMDKVIRYPIVRIFPKR